MRNLRYFTASFLLMALAGCRLGGSLNGAVDVEAVLFSFEDSSYTLPLNLTASIEPSDIEGSVRFTASGLPDGLEIDQTSGVISGTPGDSGTYSITIEAESEDSSQSLTFEITVLTYSFLVNSTGDDTDANPGDGVCATAGGECTLRAAIAESGVIDFDQTVMIPANTTVLLNSEIELDHRLIITGEDRATSIISGQGTSRIFNSTSKVVGILNLTLYRGRANTNGGCLLITDASVIANEVNFIECRTDNVTHGGAVYLSGTNGLFRVFRSSFTRNEAGIGGAGNRLGSAIFVDTDSSFRIESTTFDQNLGVAGIVFISDGPDATIESSTFDSNDTLDAFGGGTIIVSGRTVDINNTTVSKNRSAFAPAVYSTVGATVNISNSTIVENDNQHNTNASGVGTTTGGTVTLHNTIVAENMNDTAGAAKRANCAGVVTSLGYNIYDSPDLGGNEDLECSNNFAVGTDQTETDPDLGTLADNGGNVQTYLPAGASPARDMGDPVTCPAEDARDQSRPFGASCDVGAVEVQDGE